MPAIESFSLSKLYPGSKIPALTQITLSIAEGRIFTLLGRNGAGKTTFLRIAATQLLPTKGRIDVLGHEVVTEAKQIRSRIAVVPQEGSTVGPLTAWDHVFLSLLARGMSLSEARSRAHDTLDQLELLEFRNKPADILSGGLKQRIRVAMAIATDAELIFLDEPTLGLDAVARRKLWDVLKGISKDGRTILLTTHYMEEAEILSDHVAVVHQGGVVREGHPRDLLAAIKENAKVDMVGDAFSDQELVTYGRLVKIAERRRVFTSREHASELAAEVLKRKGHATVAPVSLEDVFVELVQDGEEES